MTLAIASGKGGTGKTSLSAAVAQAMAVIGPVQLLDCDVEEPNAQFFIQVPWDKTREVTVPIPEIDPQSCTACGLCSDFCQYNALATVGDRTLVFPELCHHCGGCSLLCPTSAIREVPHRVGVLEEGQGGNLSFAQGILDVGQSMSTSLIRAVRNLGRGSGLTILDCPPGTSCPMVTAVRDSDYVILVTEPTPFGLNDLKLAIQTVQELGISCGVVINRCDSGDSGVVDYCQASQIPILLQIPESRAIAEAYSRGQTMITVMPQMVQDLQNLVGRIRL